MARFSYLAKRAIEAGPRVVGGRIWHRVKPYCLYPFYLAAKRGIIDRRSDAAALVHLGDEIRAAVALRVTADQCLRERMAARAHLALAARVPVLGFGDAEIPHGPGWWTDPFHGYVWPLAFFPKVDFIAHHSRSDVKIPWELSRLQYTLWLAEGALVEPAKASLYASRFEEIVSDWQQANPVGWGVNWTVSMEVAIRGVNLLLAGAILSEGLDENFSSRLVGLLAAHYRFIQEFPETSDINGNHYLANLMGLTVLSTTVASEIVFGNHLQKFALEADRQFEADGCHIERAPIYHRLCLDMVAVVAAFELRLTGEVSPLLNDVLRRGIRFARFLAGSAGALPIFGDCDSGKVLELGASARDFSAVNYFAGGQVAKPDDDFGIWLHAIAGKQLIDDNDGCKAVSLTNQKSGFIAAKLDDLVVVMRTGRQGLGGRAPHDHDDALSIWVTFQLQDIVIDRGCHSYTLDAELRRSFIKSEAHNIIQPKGRSRYEGQTGSIYLTMRGAPYCADTEFSNDGSNSTFTGILTDTDLIRDAKRTVSLSHNGGDFILEVADSWISTESTELNWHFAPGIKPVFDGHNPVRFEGIEHLKSVVFEGVSAVEAEIFEFDYYPVYGRSEACYGIRLSVSPTGENRLVSTFIFQSPAKRLGSREP